MNAHLRLKRQLLAAMKRALAGGKPVVPEAGHLLWSWFIEMNSGRTNNGFGPNPLSWVDIASYSVVKRWPLSDTHISILRAMDVLWLEHDYSKESDGKRPRQSPGQKISPSAFDAVFG